MLQRLKSKKLIFILFIFILGAGGYFYFTNRTQVVPVEEVDVNQVKIVKTVSGSGEVISESEASLDFTLSGKIMRVAVDEGDLVEKDDLIATLDTYSAYQSAQAAKHARDKTLRDRDLFIENYETNLQAYGGKDEYEIQLRKLNEAVDEAEANYQSKLGSLSSYYIYAPFEGTIVDTFYKEGESVAANTAVVKIADLNQLVFEATVDQEDFGVIELGQEVELDLDAYDETLEGEIIELPKYANASNSNDFVVKINILENGHNVLLGMTGDATIVIEGTTDEVQALIFDRVFEDDQGTYVWVMQEGQAAKKYIETGIEGDVYTEVTTDLSQDTIIFPVDTEAEFDAGTPVSLAQ